MSIPGAIVDSPPVAAGAFAPVDATYVVVSLNAVLTNERVLTAGAGIALVDGGAGGAITVSATSDAGPWDETGTVVHLDTATNTVAVGVAVMSGIEKMRVVGAAGDMGILSEVTGTGAAFVPTFQGLAAHTGTGQFIGLFVSGTIAQTGGAFAGSIVRSTLAVAHTGGAWVWTGFHCNSQITGAAGTATQWASFHNQTGKTGAGTVTDMIGYLSAPSGGGGTVTRYYGFFASAFALPGTEIGGFFQGASAAIEVGTGTPAARTTNGVWFEDGDMVLNGSAMAGTEILRVVGDARIEGKLTVTGAIDPPSVLLSGGTALFYESDDGNTAPVSGAATGRIRYDDGAAAWQISVQTGAYVDILTAAVGSTAFIQDGNSFGALATLGTNDANALAFETSGVERMRIFSGAAHVGIGVVADDGTSALRIDELVNGERRIIMLNTNAGTSAKATIITRGQVASLAITSTSVLFTPLNGQESNSNILSSNGLLIVQTSSNASIKFKTGAANVLRMTLVHGVSNVLQGSAGFTIEGGAAAGNDLTLRATASTTDGSIFFFTDSTLEVQRIDSTGVRIQPAGVAGAAAAALDIRGDVLGTEVVATSGSPSFLTFISAAHTTLAASTEAITANFNFSATVQFATGALATQRAFVIQEPTYGFVAASTITTAATFAIVDAPQEGTNATITTALAFWVQAGATQLDGAASVNFTSTTAFVVNQTGGGTPALVVNSTNSFVGVGTAPGVALDVRGDGGLPVRIATNQGAAASRELIRLQNDGTAGVGNGIRTQYFLDDDGAAAAEVATIIVNSTAIGAGVESAEYIIRVVTAGTLRDVYEFDANTGAHSWRAGAAVEQMRYLDATGLRIEPGGVAGAPAAVLQVIGDVLATTVDATTDFTVGATVITDGVITDAGGLQIAAALDMATNTISNVGAATNDWTATGITTAGSVAIGVAGSDQGSLTLAGVTSGVVTVAVAAVAGTWTLTLPIAVAAIGGEQLTDAAGNGVASWAAAASNRASKNISGEANPQDALSLMLDTKAYRFHYKEGRGTRDYKTEYVGPVAEEAPWAMHYNRGIVNPVNTLGYMLLGFQAQGAQLAENRAEIQRLKDRIVALEAA